MELHTLTALELGEKLRSGEVTRQEAVEAALSRIRAAQGTNNAFITVTDPPAPAAEGAVSPLAGVPMAYKDNICTKGVRTTCASRILGTSPPATTPRWRSV